MGVNYFKRDPRDLKFVLSEHMDLDSILSYEPYRDFEKEDFEMVIEEALKVCRDKLGPAMQDGDREGVVYHEDGNLFFLIDVSMYDPDEETRKLADARVGLLTPLVKAYCSDFGYLLCREAIHVLGGVGYCSEFPTEQYARDILIVSIWEGTNYIQSLDLVGRKLGLDGGKAFRDWIGEVVNFTSEHKEDPDLGKDFKLVYKAAQATGDFAMRYMKYFQDGRFGLIPLTSKRFLECFAETVMGHLILQQGLIARDKLKQVKPESADGIFYRGKIESARFYCRNILTNVFSRHASLELEDTSALDIPEEAF